MSDVLDEEGLDETTVDVTLADPYDGQELRLDAQLIELIRTELTKMSPFGRGRLVRIRVALTIEPWPGGSDG